MSTPETPAAPDAPPAGGSELQSKAAEVLGRAEAPERRGPGRPRGSRTRNRSRASSGAPAPPREPAAAPPAEPPSDSELRGLGKMLGAAWRMLGTRLRRRPLTESEESELAAAAHPVLAKYGGGALDKYGAELALAFTVWGLWESTEIPAVQDDELPGEPHPDELGAVAGA